MVYLNHKKETKGDIMKFNGTQEIKAAFKSFIISEKEALQAMINQSGSMAAKSAVAMWKRERVAR